VNSLFQAKTGNFCRETGNSLEGHWWFIAEGHWWLIEEGHWWFIAEGYWWLIADGIGGSLQECSVRGT
jgi:hypothetical protein